MSDLSSHGWRVEGAAAEDMSEVDMKAMFVDADFQRRNSSELMVPPPRKVTMQSTNCQYSWEYLVFCFVLRVKRAIQDDMIMEV